MNLQFSLYLQFSVQFCYNNTPETERGGKDKKEKVQEKGK